MIIHPSIPPSYIFGITEKMINSSVYDLGTKYDRIFELVLPTLVSDHYAVEEKTIDESTFNFLIASEFIDEADYFLTESGKKYFEALYIHRDGETASTIIKQKIQLNPIVNLVGQVFYGRGKISNDQLQILLNYHKVADAEVDAKNVVALLTILNKYGIVVYDKKNRLFYIKETVSAEEPICQYYISPSTPFSNIYNVRKALRSCAGDIYWIDKHFRKEGLEMALDGLAYEGVKSLTIISGSDNATESAKRDYNLLQQELSERQILLTWRIITDTTFKWHDRWIVADNYSYNVPPVLAILRGQRAEILKTNLALDVNLFLEASINIS